MEHRAWSFGLDFQIRKVILVQHEWLKGQDSWLQVFGMRSSYGFARNCQVHHAEVRSRKVLLRIGEVGDEGRK